MSSVFIENKISSQVETRGEARSEVVPRMGSDTRVVLIYS